MFTNITEEDIRVNCPEYAPMTIKMLNKLNPLKVNSSVNPLNPYTERRTAPTSINQFVQTSTYTFNRPASQAGMLMERLVSGVEVADLFPIADEVLPDVPVPTEDLGIGGLGGLPASPDRVDQFEEVELVINADGTFGYADNPSVDPFDALMSTSAAKEMESRREATLRDEIADEMRGAGRQTAEELKDKELMNLM